MWMYGGNQHSNDKAIILAGLYGEDVEREKVELDMRYGKDLGIIKIIPHTYLQGTVLSALHTYYLISSLNLENKLV